MEEANKGKDEGRDGGVVAGREMGIRWVDGRM